MQRGSSSLEVIEKNEFMNELIRHFSKLITHWCWTTVNRIMGGLSEVNEFIYSEHNKT